MTYEELLDKIEAIDYWQEHFANRTFLKALRAVVLLHKVQPTTVPGDPKCDACSGLDWEDYPCPTIQAIEKALS